MNAQRDIQMIFHDLMAQKQGQVFLCSNDMTLRVFDDGSKLSMSCPVYFGSNYIPASVREAIKKHPPFGSHFSLKTYFTVDEEHYRIFLKYIGSTEELTNMKFFRLMKEFEFMVEEWRIFLDEHDSQDLIYISKNR